MPLVSLIVSTVSGGQLTIAIASYKKVLNIASSYLPATDANVV